MMRSSTQVLLTFSLLLSACQPKLPADGGPPVETSNGGNLIKNSGFDGPATVPWMASFSGSGAGKFELRDGAGCVLIENAGVQNWDAQLYHREMVAQKGHVYTSSFKIWASSPTRARVKIGMSTEPYAEYYHQEIEVTTSPQIIRGGFVMERADDPTAEFALHLGGRLARETTLPVTVCIDDVQLIDPTFVPPPRDDKTSLPGIFVNQLGYFPGATKIAVWVSSEAQPQVWNLKKGDTTLVSGITEVVGPDRASGDSVHVIDFSSVTKQDDALVLLVGDDRSDPFSISNGLYQQLKYDALRYFYHNRSGIPIEMPYAGDEKWARKAGHAQSDKAVPCAPDAGCDYSLDVSKGWYDAGDHGKYVVNGGISVWTLQNQFERSQDQGQTEAVGDGPLKIPESGNGIPDLLDEARWEMEFLLGMQVPEGNPHAGMAHHKIHDIAWTGLGLAPHEAEEMMKRQLRPVSTAATLNLAAAAAQGARLFASFDPEFAQRCSIAAQRAYRAAKKEPTLYASPKDSDSGGGPYDDDDVSDEFFWAAAELYITTREVSYLTELRASKYWTVSEKDLRAHPRTINWSNTALLGTMSLSLDKSGLNEADRKHQKLQLLKVADRYLELIQQQGYRLPYAGEADGKYPWGSNSSVLNNMLVLAYGYDISGRDEYLEAVVLGMDYLLGRNPLGQSYVTGYGSRPLHNPHHRFWAHQHNPQFPSPPPGAISGGPNSSLQDPRAQAEGLEGCKPQKCFVDHIDAWSLNEIAINWNAPLAWLAFFLDEKGPETRAAASVAIQN